MKICIMTDLEGVAGVINAPDWIYPQSRYYEEGKRLLTTEVNAAIEGFYRAGATEIVVQDGHGAGAVNCALLDERAQLQRGWHGPYPFGVEEGYDVMAWVGQHAMSRTPLAHLAHTGSFSVLESTINGIAVGEFGECAFCALEYNCVPIFGSGDLAFTKEAQALFPGIGTVAVKRGVIPESGDECSAEEYAVRNAAAIHTHPKRACRLIEEGAYAALTRFRADPGSFHRDFPAAPYRMVTRVRRNKDTEAGTHVREHPASVTALLNSPYHPL